jgi:hypothetical protein
MTGSLCGVTSARVSAAHFHRTRQGAKPPREAAPAEVLPRHFKRELAEQARLRAAV